MDRPLQEEAQEGTRGGRHQEEDSPRPEVPARRGGRHPQDIMAKRNQKPEVRKAQREQAVRAAKETKKSTVKKPAPKDSKAKNTQKAAKNTQKSKPMVGGKR